jgi:heptosyltransferase-3
MTYGDYPDLSCVRRILVIKLRHLGDVLLTTPLLSTLKKRFPEAQIDVYINQESALILEGHFAISNLLLHAREKKGKWARVWGEIKTLRHIRRNRYDLVVNLTEGDRGAIAAKFSKAPIRVGSDPKKSGFWGKGQIYTHVAKQSPGLRHTVERNLDVLRRIGIFPDWDSRELFFEIPAPVLQRVKSWLPQKFLLIHPTSRWRFKCWPKENVRALAEALLRKGSSLVFSSGPDIAEQEMVASICEGLPVLNLAGKITLKELGALIYLSEQLVCVDSLPFHLASALKKPVVALFGPTSEVTWGPWRNPQAQVLTQPFSCRPCYQDGCGGSKKSDCLLTLPVETVLESISKNGSLAVLSEE